MAISNPVSGQGIVDRFETLVTDVANAGIVYGISNKPFTEMPNSNYSLECNAYYSCRWWWRWWNDWCRI